MDDEDHPCRFCGSECRSACRSSRDMKDRAILSDPICFAALMMHGGGEYTEDRLLSQELMRRAGLKRETGS